MAKSIVSKKVATKKSPKKVLPAPPPAPKTKKIVQFIDSSFFFPSDSLSGYSDHFQDGRYTRTANHELVAPLMLAVGSTLKKMTVYYKNNTDEDMMVFILKKHIHHHAYSGEVEVTIDSCPPGTLAPDDYLAKLVDHFDAGGKIKTDYLYYISIGNTVRTNEETVRTLRGIRLEYTVPI